MNKVVTINLNGRAYQLEEDGFDILRSYLDNASTQLANDPGKTEIVADLEQAIAEKCDKILNSHKTVVTTLEIKNIIEDMGPVEGTENAKSTGGAGATQGGPTPRRLYRIEEGSMLWGICTGLAAFFGIDVTLVRIIFVVGAIFTGGAFFLAYFVMKVIVPEADTMQEKAAAHGDPFNAQELVNRAKQEYERLSAHLTDKHDVHRWKHDMRRQRRERRHAAFNSEVYRYRPNPLLGLLRGILAVLWILALISLITTGAIFGWFVPAGIPLWLSVIILFILYHAVTGPMKGAQYTSGNNTYVYSEWDGLSDGLTVLFLAIAFGWAYLHVPEFYTFVHHPIIETKEFIGKIKTQLH